ncbi:hypothetical protein PENSPDRAFT_689667 [Peniophora sp. CONT]|nr:hypothetical protein PENSPDRAFT_689667 [Peniophora sp. CONT]
MSSDQLLPLPLSPQEWDTMFTLPSPRQTTDHAALKTTPLFNAQLPTPPSSDEGEEGERDSNTVVSVSAAFHPGAQLHAQPPDMILVSSDSVWFYVHTQTLAISTNDFHGVLHNPGNPENPPIIPLPEASAELNVLLHSLYNMSAAPYSPSPANVAAALDALHKYGMNPITFTAPHSPLFLLMIRLASMNPLECFAIAAERSMHDLLTAISSFLLACHLPDVTDEQATRIGPLYLKRLFFLHLGRMDALKRILLPPPASHPPSLTCDYVEQKQLTRAWALATAYLAWEAKPDISIPSIEAALRPLGEHLSCAQCQGLLRERISNLVVQWSLVKRTI